jgi:CRP/FNR family transcriptional regulator
MTEAGSRLRSVRALSGLGTAELEQVDVRMRERLVPAGRDLIAQGEPGDGVFVILEGSVKMYRRLSGGAEVILAIAGPGEVVGEMPPGEGVHATGVATLEDARVLSLDGDSFRQLLDDIPSLPAVLVTLLSERLHAADARIESLAGQDVEGRVACVLLELARQHGVPKPGGGTLITIPLTQADVAAMTGASRVRVNQVIARFRHEGWVTLDGRRRTSVQDPAALESRCR